MNKSLNQFQFTNKPAVRLRPNGYFVFLGNRKAGGPFGSREIAEGFADGYDFCRKADHKSRMEHQLDRELRFLDNLSEEPV